MIPLQTLIISMHGQHRLNVVWRWSDLKLVNVFSLNCNSPCVLGFVFLEKTQSTNDCLIIS